MKIKLPKLSETMEIEFADKQMNWKDAMDWAKAQGGRLPTKFELQVLAESGEIPDDKRSFWYWSASSVSLWTAYAWFVDLSYGLSFYDAKTASGAAICVS
jgi:hypothetical protein